MALDIFLDQRQECCFPIACGLLPLAYVGYTLPTIEIVNKDAGCCKPAVVGYAVTDCGNNSKKTLLTGFNHHSLISGISVTSGRLLVLDSCFGQPASRNQGTQAGFGKT